MRALIFGCGYLGERLARAWLADGHQIFAVTRRSARAAILEQAGIRPVVGDVTEETTLKGLPRVDVAVWAVGLDRSAGLPMRRVYVDGLANALSALPGPSRFIYVSSTGVYGQSDGSEVDENCPTMPVEESGKVVLEAEQLLRTHRPDAVILRFAGIYGLDRLLRSKDLLAGKALAIDPNKWLNLIHVEDGVRAVQAASERGLPGQTYNVSDDRPVRRVEFYSRLAERLGAPPVTFIEPKPDSTAAAEVNRRIVNRRLRQELEVKLLYPTFEEGLAASCPPSPVS